MEPGVEWLLTRPVFSHLTPLSLNWFLNRHVFIQCQLDTTQVLGLALGPAGSLG